MNNDFVEANETIVACCGLCGAPISKKSEKYVYNGISYCSHNHAEEAKQEEKELADGWEEMCRSRNEAYDGPMGIFTEYYL